MDGGAGLERPLGTPERWPFVSVIVPVFNDGERLRTCLAALDGQCYPRSRYEVVVVDNGSDIPVDEKLGSGGRVRFVRETRAGSYRARNAGIAAARGDLLAFTDSDCIPDERWIRAAVEFMRESPGAAIVGGPVRVFPLHERRPTLGERHQSLMAFSQRRNVEERHYSVTANLFTYRRVFDTIGVFREELMSGGDREWGQRAYRAGLSLRYCEAARVDHPARRSVLDLLAKYARTSGGQYQLARQRRESVLALVSFILQTSLTRYPRYWSPRTPCSLTHRGLLSFLELLIVSVKLAELLRLRLGGAPRRR